MDKFGIKQAVNVEGAEIQFKDNQMWAEFYLLILLVLHGIS